MNNGQVEEAIVQLEVADRLEPNGGDILNLLGVAYARAGDYPRAIALFKRVLGIDPAYSGAAVNLANAERMRMGETSR